MRAAGISSVMASSRTPYERRQRAHALDCKKNIMANHITIISNQRGEGAQMFGKDTMNNFERRGMGITRLLSIGKQSINIKRLITPCQE